MVFQRGMNLGVQSGHPVGWDFTEVYDDFVKSNADLTRLRVTLSGWGDAIDDYKVGGLRGRA